MALFLVSYDLHTPGQDYPALTTALKKLGGVKILLSVWLVPGTNRDVVHSAAKDALDSNDRLFTVQLRHNAAWTSLLASDDVVKRLFTDHAG